MNIFPGYDIDREQHRIIQLSSLGGMLEFFDFTVYALFAGYFASQYFPVENQLISIIAAYTVFVIGYLIRPIGGIIFSHIGDEVGRKKVLVMTMTLMGVATFGIGLLPTYKQIGVYAPILMIVLRLIQGIAFGGEIPSMIVYVTETMPTKRGFGIGGSFSGTVFGIIIGMLVNLAMVYMLTKAEIATYGWRIPFFLGGVLCFVAYRARQKLHETNAFKHQKSASKIPFFELLRKHSFEVFIGIGLVSIVATAILLLIVFMPTYLNKIVKLPSTMTGGIVLVTSIVAVLSAYLFGWLAQKINLHQLTKCSLLLILVFSSLCYYLISVKQHLYLGFILFAVFEGGLITLPIIYLSYLFPVEVRLSGVALVYNISFVIFGGLTPILVTGMIEKTGWVYVTPMIFMLISTLFAYWSVSKAQKYVD